MSITIILSWFNPENPVLTNVELKELLCAEVAGKLKEEYKLENALPLVGILCTEVKVNEEPVTVFHPLPLKGTKTLLKDF